MEANSALTLISKDKISHFLGILPLITFILLDIKFILIIIYTIFFAIWEVYILNMESFNKLVTKEITIFDKNNKIETLVGGYFEKFFKEADKNDFMQSTYALATAVVDEASEIVTYLTPKVRGINSITFKELKNVGGKKETDVTDLLQTLFKSKLIIKKSLNTN